MITATCTTNDCRWHGVPRYVLGDPKFVMCGHCKEKTALTDPQPDPPRPPDEE